MIRPDHPDDLIVVRTYGHPHEAEAGRSMLMAYSIEAVTGTDNVGGPEPVGTANDGVNLLVRRRDESKAQRLLAVTIAQS